MFRRLSLCFPRKGNLPRAQVKVLVKLNSCCLQRTMGSLSEKHTWKHFALTGDSRKQGTAGESSLQHGLEPLAIPRAFLPKLIVGRKGK